MASFLPTPPSPPAKNDGGFADPVWQRWFSAVQVQLTSLLATIAALPATLQALFDLRYAPISKASFKANAGGNVLVVNNGLNVVVNAACTQVYDKSPGTLNPANALFTAPVTGEYHFSCSISMTPVAINTLNYVGVGFRTGVTDIILSTVWDNDTTSGIVNQQYLCCSTSMRLVAGATVAVLCVSSPTSGGNCNAAILDFTGHMIDNF